MITLYHYSNKDISGYIKPDFFGENSYTSASKNLSGYKRSYFYADDKSKEYFFNSSKFLYTAEIKQQKIYNLETDILKCLGNFNSISDFISYLMNKGYSGFKNFNGKQEVICIFKSVKIKNRKTIAKY
jgi:hypothetical protein